MKHFRRRVYTALLSPDGLLKSIQALVLTGVLLFESFYIPFALSYLSDAEDSVEYLATASKINVVVEILLVTDLLLNFNTSIRKPSRNTSLPSRKEIVRRYLTGSFMADLLGSLPAECICFLLQADDSRSLLQISLPVYIICHIFRFLRFRQIPALYKSVWVQNLMEVAKVTTEKWFGSFQPLIFTVFRLAAGVIVMAHYLTCLLRGFQLSDNFHHQTSLSSLYSKHLRQVIVGMFGGVNETENGINDAYCIFLVLIGLITMSFIFSSIFIAVANLQTTRHTQITRELKSTMEKLKLPNELRDRIQRYSDHMWSEYDTVHRDILGFTRKLPQSLALEVLHHRYSDLVSGLEFWPESSPEFVSALLLSVDIRVFGLADIILREGEVGTELFMIHRGFVELTGPVKEVQTLTQGCTFGELALLLDCTRATCVRTVTYVESCALDRQVFYRVLNRYPENRTRVVENVLAAGLRSNECPELWARAKTLFEDRTPVETDSSGVNDVKETQLSSSAAARILVQAMKLGKGPDMRTPACVHQDIADTNIRPNNGLVDTQILPVLTALSNSIRRLEDDFGLMKELVKEKLEKGESGVNEAAIELTLPQLSIKANESPATISSTNESTAIKDSDPTMFTSKVQAKPSRFRRAVSVSSLLDAARQMKHGSNVTVGDIRSSTSPDSRGLHPKMPPRRTLQRRMSR